MNTSWNDELTTPLGAVCCELVSDLPIDVSTDNPGSAIAGGYLIKRSLHVLADNWNLGRTQVHHPIDGGCCWRWYFTRFGSGDASLMVRCRLTDPSKADWDIACGERLAAIEYFTEGFLLHIGTEDHWKPTFFSKPQASTIWARLRPQQRPSIDPPEGEVVRMDETGLTVRVPKLRSGESLYFHMIAAHKRTSSREDISTWMAVDRTKSELDRSTLSP